MRGRGCFGLIGTPLFLFLLLPVVALGLKGVGPLQATVHATEAREALAVSLRTTAASLVILVALGTPLAFFLSAGRSWPVKAIETVVQLPLVLPPAAAGIALLLALGRHGLVPTSMPFTAAAVVAAQVFVAAPIFVQAASTAFHSVSNDLLDLAATEGATASRSVIRIAIPIAAPGLLGGALVAWARMLGEFGATILFAGNLLGRTQTLPLAIYLGFETDLDQAIGLSFLLLGVAALVLVMARMILRPATTN